MLRSVYSGITGMRINQLWFDVISENMANVNTPGFKKSRISFEDLLNQTFSDAMSPIDNVGGLNPMQVGLGAKVSLIEVIHTQGTVKETQVPTDLLINGAGYFVVSNGSVTKYTRAGNFTFDSYGNLINQSNGFKLLGWNAERDKITGQLVMDVNNNTKIDRSKALEGIVINADDMMSPKATTKTTLKKNINASTNIAFSPINLEVTKYIKSVVPVSSEGVIDLTKSWTDAGFENTPTGTITLGPEGCTQTFSLGSSPQDLINAINSNSGTTGISIEYADNKFTLEIDPNNPSIKEENGKVVLSETPVTGKTGFFTEAKIPTGTYNAFMDIKMEFEHILDPSNPDNYYLRWKALDSSSNQISTNAYYYVTDDYGVAPGQVAEELVGYSDGNKLVFELDNPDVDPISLQIYVYDPDTGEKTLYSPYKLPYQEGDTQTGYTPPANSYYFDDNGQTEVIYPLTGTQGGPATNIGKSKNGVDRIIFIKSNGTEGPPLERSKIVATYMRNGFNMSQSTVDPTTLQIKIDGAVQNPASYTFNNNLGIGGKDQITFFSTTSTEEVVSNSLNIGKSFEEAGFNSATHLVMSADALASNITISWTDGNGSKTWTSDALSSYYSVADFLAAVTAGVNGQAGSEIIDLSYDQASDKFILKNEVALYIGQSHAEGFLTHAKLPGEGKVWNAIDPTLNTRIEAFENPESREEVVKNTLDTSKIFTKAGFNNGFEDVATKTITFTWTSPTGASCSWTSDALDTYASVNQFINHVNHAVDSVTGGALPITMRYDSKTDRFTIVNTNSTVKVSQNTLDGFLTKAKLLTTGVEQVSVPVSPTGGGKVPTADYNYNKTVTARGMLQLNADYKVINNFRDTESVSEITSSTEVIEGSGDVNLSGNWNQFDSGTVNGVITIETDGGTYISREINSTDYPTVQSLLNEINASDAKVSITYDPTTDKFTIKSQTEGGRISLSETGTTPFFSEINITLGTIQGGNNNGVMDLSGEKPTPTQGWAETTDPAGTGRDFIRVNMAPNEVKGESLGTAGAGKPGTQVIKQIIDYDPTTAAIDALPGPVDGKWTLTLPHKDVDKDTIVVYYSTDADPTTAPTMLPATQVSFKDNTGTGGEDQIVITQAGDPLVPATGQYIYVDYTRLNAFDLHNPDVDPTTLVLKVNNVIQQVSDFTFQDNTGTNGVDRIILDKSYGTGTVKVDYRQVAPLSVDIFIPNGNTGPENITFIPNTNVDTGYYGCKTSDLGSSKTTTRNDDYIVSLSRFVYDSLGKAWNITYNFEKLGTNKWIWSVLNPSNLSKFGGYGIISFDEYGDYDEENSKVFDSPSDEKTSGTKFAGVFFDPETTNKGATAVQITSDFTKLHQFAIDGDTRASSSSAYISSQDGYPTGTFESKTINSEGFIVARYTNDQIQYLGQIGLATFANPSGLLKESGTLFRETLNSGEAQIGRPGEEGRGVIAGGQIEMANVDLVEEFTDLIIAQRAFQANSRIIVTDDQILTEIVNLKR